MDLQPGNEQAESESVHNFDTGVQIAETISTLEAGTANCFHAEAEKTSGLVPCSCSLNQPEEMGTEYQRYCLPLPNARLTIGLIHIYLPKSYKLLDDQKNLLNRIVPEAVLAINKFLLQRANLLQKEAVQSERQRIASDLHDTLGQDLAYLRSKIDQLVANDHVDDMPVIKKELQQMSIVAADANKTIRNIISTTRSTSKNPLDVRLLEYASSIGDRSGFKVSIHSEGSIQELPSQMQFQIFLIFREIMANIEKHANARNVSIDLSWKEELVITISDDGRGFLLDDIDKREHFGLSIIQSRTDEMNGNLSMTSKPDKGTLVSIHLPLPAHLVEV